MKKLSEALWKIDCHVHTCYSRDCRMTLEQIIQACEKKSLNAIAVTDHNCIQGAVVLKKNAPFTVIIGEEIKTKQGEIIGYFLSEQISPYRDVRETIKEIKAQGGLVCVPHPFDRLRKSALQQDILQQITNEVDIIEIFNARNLFSADNDKAKSFALYSKKVASIGSDAHTIGEIGASYAELPPFRDADSFLCAMADATLVCQSSSWVVHVYTKWEKFWKGCLLNE